MSHKNGKLAALEALKLARQGGRREYKEEEDVTIYDEVSEEAYKRIVKGRLQRDDFVEDDGVDGYADNGMDDWSDEDEGYRDSDVEMEETKKKKSRLNSAKAKQNLKEKSKSKAKATAPPPVAPSFNDYRKKVTADQENDFMLNLFGELDALPTNAPSLTKSRKRKTSPDYDASGNSSPAPYRKRSSYTDASSDGPDDFYGAPSSDDFLSSPRKRVKTEPEGLLPATERLAQIDVKTDEDDFPGDESFDDIDMDAFMAVEDDVDMKPVASVPVETSGMEHLDEKKPASWLAVYDSLTVSSEDPLGPLATNTSSIKSSDVSALEPDGSLRFFWVDYLEHQGELFFIGKLKDKKSGAWVSCCVAVKNLERNLFILPREKRAEQGEDDEWYDTDEVPELTDVYKDFDAIRSKRDIKKFKGKFVERQYAFGDPNIPRKKTTWMKVAYHFTDMEIPSDAQSPNIAKIFGTNTSAFELLVLKRKIMGPCWIQIRNPQIDNAGVSWCKLEVVVDDPKDFNPMSDSDDNVPKETPPLNVMSLSVRTIVNHRENKREVVCVAARTWRDMIIDGTTPPEHLPCTVQTFVRPLGNFPSGFEASAKANGRGFISPMKNERMLLNALLVSIQKNDPDIIVGHDFLGVSLDVLLHRMRDLKADHWSRIGRFRRSAWPRIGKQGTNIKFLTGRMLCDLSSDAAKSMITSTTWSLTEMCKSQLKSDREEIDPDDTASYFDGSIRNPDRLMTFVRHCELDAHYHMAIAAKVQILPLTKQLTNLAGNSWNKTLNGGRAERNEYILLHEFHRLKFICPDKSWGKKAAPVKVEPVEDDPEAQKDAPKGKNGKKDKYKGGLVLDPRKGLWNSYVLVMDFNSLYPSIIQEYNIDFTTIDKTDVEEIDAGEEGQLDLPGSDVPQGVLPRIIATLVNRRKQVKSLMKDRTATDAQLAQWDIKQKALKLTANSMYGCLGFEYSRFYARPLAALTTHMGREILQHTKELAETMHLDVLYGDTDSLFVNSNASELSEALRISNEFKKVVNERYRKLEIDLDAIFQRLLLLQKKKYAAVKVENGAETSIEVKGLDMKRREYCTLSKNVSQFVLERILSGEATEIVVEQIHDYLTSVGENVRGGTYQLDAYVINKRLGKNPEDYPKAEGQPHVQVALKMKAKGGNARAGDVIPYVFCLADGEQSTKTSQSDRARHRDEVRRVGSGLTIDADYYLSQQILPPVQRLCEEIEGIDRAHLAECLGLDVSKYRGYAATGSSEDNSFASLDSLKSDKERYKEVYPFAVTCKNCKGSFEFRPLNDPDCCLRPEGPLCPSCSVPLSLPSLQAQMETQIRKQISLFYQRWVVCSDQTCGYRTRMMGIYGRTCLRPGCFNKVVFEYSDEKMYTQLRYYSYLVDGERAVKNAAGTAELESIGALAVRHSELLRHLSICARKYLDEYAWRWVDLGHLFGTMKLK
ncbi:DNA polymerase family B-domain-containing protein [Lentinula edodes]|nr:DNA polymerase family B-domain-containing protein [Lentinula edodes]